MHLSEKASMIGSSATLAIDAKVKRMKSEGIDVISFGAGEPDFDTPQYIKEAAVRAIGEGYTKYTPASGTFELKTAICRKLKNDNGLDYKEENIVVSNGAKHSLTNAFLSLCDSGDEVIIPAPFWISYPEMVKLAGGVPVLLETSADRGFSLPVDRLEKAITGKTRVIVLNSPNNPTGAIYTREQLAEVARIAVNKGIYVISDEIYEKLIYDRKEHSSIASISEEIKAMTILVNGFSKTYSMTGWRVGYSASHPAIARAMDNIQSHMTSNPNSIAQKAAVAALNGDQSEIAARILVFEKRRDHMLEGIRQIRGLSCQKPEGAFYILVDIRGVIGKRVAGIQIRHSMDFADIVLEKARVALVPGQAFGAEGFVRLSYTTSMEKIVEGLERMKILLEDLR